MSRAHSTTPSQSPNKNRHYPYRLTLDSGGSMTRSDSEIQNPTRVRHSREESESSEHEIFGTNKTTTTTTTTTGPTDCVNHKKNATVQKHQPRSRLERKTDKRHEDHLVSFGSFVRRCFCQKVCASTKQ